MRGGGTPVRAQRALASLARALDGLRSSCAWWHHARCIVHSSITNASLSLSIDASLSPFLSLLSPSVQHARTQAGLSPRILTSLSASEHPLLYSTWGGGILGNGSQPLGLKAQAMRLRPKRHATRWRSLTCRQLTTRGSSLTARPCLERASSPARHAVCANMLLLTAPGTAPTVDKVAAGANDWQLKVVNIHISLSIYVCVYIHIYVYTYISIYIYIYTYTHTHLYITITVLNYDYGPNKEAKTLELQTFRRHGIHMYTLTLFKVVNIYVCIYIYMYIYIYIHIHMSGYIYIYIYIMHTYTLTLFLSYSRLRMDINAADA